jgi:thiol-disulfide isomerase/thioredoxin
MRRPLISLLIIICAFVAFPILRQKVFPPKLPVAQLLAQNLTNTPTNFTFSDGLGRSLTLNDFHGTNILVNVWATWCPPCKQEMASLNHLALLFANKHLKIIPVSIDVSGVSSVRSFYERLGLNSLPTYADPSKSVMDAFKVTVIPTTILINRDGREIGRMVGPAQWDAPESVKHISAVAGL